MKKEIIIVFILLLIGLSTCSYSMYNINKTISEYGGIKGIIITVGKEVKDIKKKINEDK